MLSIVSVVLGLVCVCDNTCYFTFVHDGECNDGLHPNVTTAKTGMRRRRVVEGYWEGDVGTDCSDCGVRCIN